MTAALALYPTHILACPKRKEKKTSAKGNEHAAQTQNSNHCDFIPPRHAQVPDHKCREDTNGEVGNGRADTIQICDIDEHPNVNAFARVQIQAVPKVADGRALEDGEEEEEHSNEHVERHGGIKNDNMDAIDCDAE